MMKSIRIDNWSIWKAKGIFSPPIVIQSNTLWMIGWLVSENWKYAIAAHTKERSDAPIPIGATKLFEILRNPNPLIIKPRSGNNGISEITDIFQKFNICFEKRDWRQ